jgi:hypothetical protein
VNAAEQEKAAALLAVRRAWPAEVAMVLGLIGLAWWGTAAIRLHKAIKKLEGHPESKGG